MTDAAISLTARVAGWARVATAGPPLQSVGVVAAAVSTGGFLMGRGWILCEGGLLGADADWIRRLTVSGSTLTALFPLPVGALFTVSGALAGSSAPPSSLLFSTSGMASFTAALPFIALVALAFVGFVALGFVAFATVGALDVVRSLPPSSLSLLNSASGAASFAACFIRALEAAFCTLSGSSSLSETGSGMVLPSGKVGGGRVLGALGPLVSHSPPTKNRLAPTFESYGAGSQIKMGILPAFISSSRLDNTSR